MGGTRFMVQWEEHPSHLATRLGQLLEHQTLVDVTLMCNTHTLRVHRAVLAACSPYFETILQRQLGMHPLIVLKDMQFSVLKSLIEFMYCGETSVTEDNLGALLQAAKFFQVKGLSAMTKEALGLVPNAKSAINGDAARKAFVGRPKRVGMQQTFVTSGLKSAPTSHASSSHSSTSSSELPTLPTKTTFQTISKPITARPDTQQQTDTAQLLLSLSGSEFPKQTFHTVSKNVRFQHTVSGSTVSVDSPRSSNIDSNAKTKEVVGRIPVMTPNGGKSSVTSTAATTVSQQTGQVVEHVTVGSIREDVLVTNPQSVFVSEGHRRRGRPVKRQMNMLFQERVMTDADAALHKEAEASRKALEMLRQEMSSETMETNMSVSPGVPTPISHATAISSPTTLTSVPNMSNNNVINESTQKGPVKHSVQSTSKLQVQTVQPSLGTSSRTVTSSQNLTSTTPIKKINTNIVYKPSNNPVTNIASKKNSSNSIPPIDNSNNGVNMINKVDEPEIPPLYEMSIDSAQDPPKEENVEYQVSSENVEGESDVNSGNTNVVYQMTDSSNTSAGSVMSQYMEVLKEAGLPTDVPILLDSGDGSYVTVNEEVLMNIVNGGVLQCHVTEGNFVAGDGVEFIVQEITEDEMEAVQAHVQEQTSEGEPISKEIEGSSDIINNIEDNENTTDVKPTVDLETPLAAECAETIEETKDSTMVEPEHNVENAQSEIQEGVIINQEPFEDEVGISQSQGETKIEEMTDDINETNTEPNLENSVEMKQSVDCSTVNDNKSVQAIFESGLCSSDCPSNDNASGELKNQTHGDEMSVEQALQAMMGEGSDTEMEVHASDEVQGTIKEENEVPGLETVTHTLKEEKSEDLHLVLRSEEGTEEDLRLVLSNDAGDATDTTDDNSNTYSLVSAERVIDHDEGSLVTDSEENVKLCNEVTAALSSDTNQDVGVHESVSETPICESNELENVNEQDDEPKHMIEPLQVEYNSREQSLPPSSSGEEHSTSKLEEAFQENENSEYLESTPGSEISGDSQEVLQLTSNSVASTEAVCNTSEYPKSKGAIISPSKDIPYAVGLLPLKTALEKLQAMPEYHPRKTRSSSTGKESAPDMPAARVKRKSSASDGTDKRFKASSVEESDIIEQSATEEPFDGDTTMEVVASSIPEERKETVLSMPELVTESTEG